MRALVLLSVVACTTGNYQYRGEIAAVDAIGTTSLVASGHVKGQAGEALVVLGIWTELAGAPLVHFFHDEGAAAGYSLVRRVALPGLGAAAGAVIDPCESPCWGSKGMGIGLVAGFAVAVIYDLARGVPDETGAIMPLSMTRSF